MDGMSWVDEDEAIIATNTDATECKRCAVELGYWKDDYIQYFAKNMERKAPEINRGYCVRVKAMEMFIHQFLERCGTKSQIINLGCGFDTLFWRLKDTTQAVANFVEVDFPAVVAKKYQIIKRNKALLEKICGEDGEVVVRGGDVHADGYHLVGCDLRCVSDVARKLRDAGALGAGGGPGAAGGSGAAGGPGGPPPTLLLAECVLVYLRTDAADRLLAYIADTFPNCALVVYEQVNLSDKFGEVMVRNLRARGCGLWAAASAGAAAGRLRAAGFGARAWDMAAVERALAGAAGFGARARDMAAVERALAGAAGAERDPLDEHELLLQLHQHYALAVATRGPLFADLDLYN